MKMKKIITFTAALRCLSGLHIGAGDAEMHIGGIDNTVVRDPVTQLPYVPGSSLKGKMRSLLEWRSGKVQEHPLGWSEHNDPAVMLILKLFGCSGADKLTPEEAKVLGSTRLSFWDCPANKAWTGEMIAKNIPVTEAKSENTINRITGTADNPRYTERVVAGCPFDFRLTLKVLDTDNEKELVNTVLSGLKLIEMDSLGGSGSRGYGKVAFENLAIDGKPCTEFATIDPFKA